MASDGKPVAMFDYRFALDRSAASWGFNFTSLGESAAADNLVSRLAGGAGGSGGASMGKGAKGRAAGDSSDDEVEFVRGPENELPHLRSDCISHLFSKSPKASNFASCTRCFCYLCDTPVSGCADWAAHFHANCTKKVYIHAHGRFQSGRAHGQSNAEIAAEAIEKLALGDDAAVGGAANVMWTGADGGWGKAGIKLGELFCVYEFSYSHYSVDCEFHFVALPR